MAFLTERGLSLSTEKTHITHIDDGFDFLGFNVRKYSGKLLIKPFFCKVDTAIFQAIYRWTRRRHPNKGALWIFDKYYKHPAPNNWWFHAKTRTVDGPADMFRLIRVASTKIVRHIKVIADATPYDPAYTSYFVRRKQLRRSLKYVELWQPV